MIAAGRKQDTAAFQKERVEALVARRAPGKEIRVGIRIGMLSFLIKDRATGEVLCNSPREWHPGHLADLKTDDALWQFLQTESNHAL